MSSERARLTAAAHETAQWRKWGPYLAERAWGTVREDYSPDGEAWTFLTHDQARSKAFRWGEDGIAGFCDRYQILCWSMAFWNERDAILKERFFGLIPTEGNHGEDVKEYYFHVDALPSHAWQRMIYKYPQRAFPYQQLIDENRRRTPRDPELELLDTGIFDDDRYFDIGIEIAKEDADSVVFRVTATNRGPERAPLHLIPQLWFRNTWSWGAGAPAAACDHGSAGREGIDRSSGGRFHDPAAFRASAAAPARPAHPRAACGHATPLHRQRDEHGARLRPAVRVPEPLHERRLSPPDRRRRRISGESGAARHEGLRLDARGDRAGPVVCHAHAAVDGGPRTADRRPP